MAASAESLQLPAASRTGLSALPLNRKLLLAAGVAAFVAIIAAAALWSRQPDYKVLFSNLSDRDGGSVVASLSQMNVPYRFSEVGGVIMIPADKVHDVRLRLASQGLPKGGTVGYELMETQKFGTTQFQERLNYQRGLEGELARSIMSLAQVANARVHLALPTANGFFREQQKPSASVLLTVHPGRSLDRAQVAGIVHLVASSIPDLNPRQVSVVDQTGALLSAQNDSSAQGGLDASQLQYVRSMEQAAINRILEIVEPIVGRGNVRAQVTADVDFTQSESTAEQYRPNQGNEPAAVRSQQVSESSAGAAGGPAGIPGALTNQPPGASSAPINGPAQPLNAAPGSAPGAGGRDGRREATTNYEVDKTVRVTRNATGSLRRLSAAVVINHRRTVDAEGKASLVALEAREVEQIQALVREAIGFNKDRGDALNVLNTPFTSEEPAKPVEVALWKDPEILSLARSIGLQAGLLLLGLLAIFGIIRPALKASRTPPPAAGLSTVVANEVSLPPPTPGALPSGGPQEDLIRMARDNPGTVANVVRSWVNNE
jgi:flagellar M-ring protein FliF